MSKRWVVATVGALLVAGAAAGGVAVVRSGEDPAPRVLKISLDGAGSTGGGTAQAASEASADRMMIAPSFLEEYVIEGELPALDDEATAWTSRPLEVTADDASRLAAAFGLTGEPVFQDWGSWTVGAQDGSGPNLTLSTTGLGDWWYSDPTFAVKYACATSETLVDPATLSRDPAVSGPALGEPLPPDSGDGAPAPIVPDCQPEPPADLPTDDAALAASDRLAGLLGRAADEDVRVSRDEWGVNVERRMLLGGLETPFWATTRLGSQGRVEYANGILGSFEEAGVYPRIGTAEAFARLQAGMPFPWYDDLAVQRDVASSYAEAATSQGGGSSGSSEGAVDAAGLREAEATLVDPRPDDPMPGDSTPELTAYDPAVAPAPVPDVLPVPDPAPAEVRTVTIVSVQPVLWPVQGPDGGMVLLPAYRFFSSDGGQYDVLAVPDDLVQVVAPPAEPVPEPAPLPVDSAPPLSAVVPPDTEPAAPATTPGETIPGVNPSAPVTTPTTETLVETTVSDPGIALAYVGLSEEDAFAKAGTEGRAVRVAVRDGESLAVTADFQPDRVNLVVTAGVVTDAKLG